MDFKISKRKIKVAICALAGILSMNPYFVWNTFSNGRFTYAVYIVYAFSIFAMLESTKSKRYMTARKFVGILLLMLVYGFAYLHSSEEIGIKTLIAGFLLFLNLMLYILIDEKLQKEIFKTFVFLFVVSMIPGLIYYILELFGVSLSIGTLYSLNQLNYANSVDYQSVGSIGYYKHYLGAVMRVNNNTRFAGMYDEAGLIGTVSALCLAARKFELKRNTINKWLLIFLILSFSLAGYLLAILYFFIKRIRRKQWKLCFGIIALVVGFFIFMNIKTDISAINTLQNRFQITEAGMSIINNRETSEYLSGYSEFLNSPLSTKIFGFGRGASVLNVYMNGSSTYKNIIYNYGYLGFGLMVFTILYLYKKFSLRKIGNHWDSVILLVLFCVSMYQRPSVFYPYYFIVLYGGYAYLENDVKYDRCKEGGHFGASN